MKKNISFFCHSNLSLEFVQNRSVTLELSFRLANKPATHFVVKFVDNKNAMISNLEKKRWGWEAREL